MADSKESERRKSISRVKLKATSQEKRVHKRKEHFKNLLGNCCDADKRKTRGTQKGLIETHIYSRNKIQVNLVK